MKYDNIEETFNKLFKNELTLEEGREFLHYLHVKGESKEDIKSAAKVMKKYSTPLEVSKDLQEKLIDIVGTGGDKSGSFNISSSVAILVASLGVPVAKHGSKAATSKSGSADMLSALGINLNLSSDKQEIMLEECGFVFMFAANHHPAMKHIMPIRKSLSHPTIFNFLGPLCNPANVNKYLLGVYPLSLQEPIAKVLQENSSVDSNVVSSYDGLDEISISGKTRVLEIQKNSINSYEIEPEDYKLKKYPFEAILGGEPEQNAQITKNIFLSKATQAQEDVVLLNSAFALKVAGIARDIQDGLEMGKEAIKSGKALNKMKNIIEISNKL